MLAKYVFPTGTMPVMEAERFAAILPMLKSNNQCDTQFTL